MFFHKFISKQSLQQGAGVIFDQGLYSLTNFLTGMLLARSLAKEDYGVYVLAFSLIISIMCLQRGVITIPYTVYSHKQKEGDFNTYLGSVFIHQIILLIMAIAFSLLFSLYFFLKGARSYNLIIVLTSFSLATIGILFRDFVRSYLLAKLFVRQSVFMGVSINIIQLFILIVFYINALLTIHNAFLIIGVCSVLPSVFFFYKNSKLQIRSAQILNDFRNNLKLGKWIVGSTIVATLSSQLYPWLLAFFADKASVAVLGVTSSLANIMGPLLHGIESFVLPKMSQVKSKGTLIDVVRIMKKSAIFLSVIFGIWVVCGILFGNYLLTIIYSSKYGGYGNVLIIAILNTFILAITVTLNSALDALERPDISFKSLVAGLIITVSVGTLLIYYAGLYGAVIGMLLSNLVSCLLRWRGLSILINDFKTQVLSRTVS